MKVSRLPQASLLFAVMLAVTLTAGCLGPITAKKSGESSSSSPSASSAKAEPAEATFTIPHESLAEKQTLEVAVTALYRSGPYLRLGVTVTCVEVSGSGCDEPRQHFSASNAATFNDNLGAFELIDPVGHKQYLTVDDGSYPYTSGMGTITRGDSAKGWAVFPAPPAGTKTLDVAVPDGGPVLADVPIGRPEPDTQEAPANDDWKHAADTTSTKGFRLPILDISLRKQSEGIDEKQTRDRKDVNLSSDVLFAFGKATLTGKAKTILNRVAAQMDEDATGTIDVTGYTDSKGIPKVNNPLSKNRAEAVSDYLKTKVGRDLTYSVSGKGEADPIAPNTKDGKDNPAGRAKNRRVTVSYRVKQHEPGSGRGESSPAKRTPKAQKPVRWSVDFWGTSVFDVTARDVQRRGDMAVAHLNVKCVQGEGDDLDGGCAMTTALGDNFNTVRDFSLYDPTSRTRYFSAENGDDVGDTVSTSLPDTTDVVQTVDAGAERDVWIYFPAPDPDTTAIDLKMPHDGATVHDVPVID